MQTTIYTIIVECAKNTVQKLRYMQTTIYTINSTDITTFDGYVLWINFFAYKLLSLTGKNMPECISVKWCIMEQKDSMETIKRGNRLDLAAAKLRHVAFSL